MHLYLWHGYVSSKTLSIVADHTKEEEEECTLLFFDMFEEKGLKVFVSVKLSAVKRNLQNADRSMDIFLNFIE